MKIKTIFIAGILLLLAAVIAACQPASTPEAAPVVTTPCPRLQHARNARHAPPCPPVVEQVPFQDDWANSPHNDIEAEAFNHWNEEDPPEVPVDCARCHSTAGYQEFVSTGAVSNAVPAPAGTIQCEACHNDATAALDSVKFPSGLEVTGTGPSSRCMQCHQGRASKVTVDDTLTKYGVAEDPDTVPAPVDDRPLGFITSIIMRLLRPYSVRRLRVVMSTMDRHTTANSATPKASMPASNATAHTPCRFSWRNARMSYQCCGS